MEKCFFSDAPRLGTLGAMIHAILLAAMSLPGLGQGHVHAELVAESTSVAPGGTTMLGLHLRMEPGWHVYWQNPGDAGFAPAVTWNAVQGIRPDSIQWPVPDTIPVAPLMTYGYRDSVLLPIPARVSVDARGIHATAHAKWLECDEICVPGKADLSLDLPAGKPAVQGATASAFRKARADLPGTPAGWTVRAAFSDSDLVLTGRGRGAPPRSLRFFPAAPGVADNAPAQRLETLPDGFRLRVKRDPFQRLVPDTVRGVLVRPDGWGKSGRGWAVSAAPSMLRASDTARTAPAAESSSDRFLPALALAFLGGILLNLMPCVLPVLSLKVLQLMSGRDGRPLLHAAAYAVGVVLSFLALAALLVTARHGGHALGWGFQMQSPRTVALLSLLMFLMALSLWGVFEPGASLAGRFGFAPSTGVLGSFFTGILATVVATPCTAPFMGSAIGWALLLPDARVFSVSAAWLAWIVGRLAGSDAIAMVAALWVAVGLGAWIVGRGALPHNPAWGRNLSRLAFLVLVGGSVALASRIAPASGGGASRTERTAFRPEMLEELRGSGKPWLLIFTADWCLSCQVNERVALSDPAVERSLEAKGVRVVTADWTARDQGIQRVLESFGRQGVPFYILSDGRRERILPEILTPRIVLSAVDSI